jgi:DTW domain-containing protein YfiP
MSHSAETWSLAESTSYHYQEWQRKPHDERLRKQYEWMRDKYLAAKEKKRLEKVA